jgi:hypothetical protein
MKHSNALMLLLVTASTALAGCQLYFGEEENNGSWTYCGSDGYYECNDDDCYWRGPECPAGGSMGGEQPGYECKMDSDCAAGCYCDNGYCNEAGFCTKDSDCGNGYVCDESRSSCEPADEQPPTACGADNDCPTGEYCDSATLKCTATCTCANDAEATANGFDYCDESRQTCLPGIDPAGDCAGDVTCSTARPACPAGQVPMISDGCYTGFCEFINSCASTPACGSYQHDADCFADTDCAASYTGINCKRMDNTPCQAGDTGCTCENFQFASCNDKAMPRTVEFNGHYYNVDQLTLRN